MYGDWQAYQRLVRFEAPVEDCIRHIDAVLAWDDKLYNRTSSYMFGVHSDQSGERNVPLTVGHFRHSRL